MDYQGLLSQIKYDRDGLVAAVAQCADSGRVLMVAWMNAEAVLRTLQSGRACYWSRSRRCLWLKGETSGHIQELRDIRLDCDGDTLLLLVKQSGMACHRGKPSCFFRHYDKASDQLIDGD